MRIAATSDLHGHLPSTPECDVLVIAGDLLPLSEERGSDALRWLDRIFRPWLETRDATVVGINGNHDFVFETNPKSLAELELPWTLLIDSGIEIDGVKLWGYPWTPNLPGWAFYGDPGRQRVAADMVPDDTDVTITHSPPLGAGNANHPEWCSSAVNEMIARVKPKAHFSGHIHEGYGTYPDLQPETRVFNVAHVDRFYLPVNKVKVIDL